MRGAEMFAVRLATRLQCDEVENAICSLYPPTGTNDYFETGSLRTYELNVSPGLMDRIFRVDPLVALRLRRVLKDFEPDVIIGHGADNLKYASMAGYLRRSARVIYKNIGTASYWSNTRGRIWFNRLWLRNVDCSVSVSENTRQDFIDHYSFDSARAIYIPNAVEVEEFDEASDPAVRRQMRSELGIEDGNVAIGMVGSLSPGKGQDSLIRAASLLIDKGLPVTLVLVGEGSERETLENQVEAAGIGACVHFLGLRKDIPRVLRGMDIFALASRSEGMPGVLIEAGLSALPSVAYDVGGVTEILTNGVTGMVVPSNDFQKLLVELEGLVNRPEWRTQLGEQARTLCRSRFDLNAVANQYQQLFDQLLSGSPLGITDSTALNADN